jgi:transcriptional regulator with XRE-family HTH domain
MNFNQFVGIKIAEFRKLKNLSQEKLAFKANIDRTYISSIERGKRSISLAIAIKLSSALEIDLLKLIEKENGAYINGLDISERD